MTSKKTKSDYMDRLSCGIKVSLGSRRIPKLKGPSVALVTFYHDVSTGNDHLSKSHKGVFCKANRISRNIT